MKQALLPLMQGFEEIEAVTIIDILRRGDVQVVTAGLESVIVDGGHGITIMADSLLEHVINQEFDLIVLAGGAGTFRLQADPRIIPMLQKHAGLGKLTAAICAAPLVLSASGLLTEKRATSYPAVKDQLVVGEYLNDLVVVDGNIITSRGAGTATEFALQLLELLQGKAIAEEVAGKIVFIKKTA
ncbi:DJ-1 family protein [Synechococcus sp. PCC 7502]|uniref:DJ-1 family glyoxalase III n=1 Tax=Synechococcus sp. PCC 7502 TaxID=1173263 RepID=UPI00029FCAE5|nr:DJ-1 family glyoxalase III [Synechococcus sp. PCC 7502]AFY72365.1 DJ-1 family protein [Synechococcus sp. PCC 7502]